MTRSGVVVLSLTLGLELVGCAAFVKPADTLDVVKARQRGDDAYLEAVCNGQQAVAHPNVRATACADLQDKQASQSTDCATLVARFSSAPRHSEAAASKLQLQFEKCGLYDEFFDTAVWFGSGAVLEDFNAPALEAAFLKYATTHRGARFLPAESPKNGGYAMRHLSSWLVDTKRLSHCAVLANAVDGASEDVRAWAIPYFKATACAPATRVTESLLASNNPEFRLWACQGLGAFGSAAAAAKVDVLASSDGFSELREERASSGAVYATKGYPIREACAQAAGQVRLRGK